jgi:predicted XRE-type DNA-binding protein
MAKERDSKRLVRLSGEIKTPPMSQSARTEAGFLLRQLQEGVKKRRTGEGQMNKEKQKALEAAGWVFEDAEDFLELTAEERAIVEMRVQLSRAIRALREKQKLTQAQLAKKMKTSQPRVNKIEAGSPGVSLEQLLNSWFALGGTAEMKLVPHAGKRGEADSIVGHGGRTETAKVKKTVAVKKSASTK